MSLLALVESIAKPTQDLEKVEKGELHHKNHNQLSNVLKS
jgi:hypothetical protein